MGDAHKPTVLTRIENNQPRKHLIFAGLITCDGAEKDDLLPAWIKTFARIARFSFDSFDETLSFRSDFC